MKLAIKITTEDGKDLELSTEDGSNIAIQVPARFSLKPPSVSISDLKEAVKELERLSENHLHQV